MRCAVLATLLALCWGAEVRVFALHDGTISEVGGGAVSNLRRLLKASHTTLPTHSSLVAGRLKGDYTFEDIPEEQLTKPKTVFRELPDRFRLSIEPRFGRYATTKDFTVSVIGTTLQVQESRFMGYGLKLDFPLPTTPEQIVLPPHVLLAADGSIQISVMKAQPTAGIQQASLASLFSNAAGAAPAGTLPVGAVPLAPTDLMALFAAAAQNAQIITVNGQTIPGGSGTSGSSSRGSSSMATTTTVNVDKSAGSGSSKEKEKDKAKKKLDAYESIRKAMSKKPKTQTDGALKEPKHQTRGTPTIVAPPL